jgi:hypothetical protein
MRQYTVNAVTRLLEVMKHCSLTQDGH